MTLRVRLLGTIVGAIVLFFLISVVAARITLTSDLMQQGAADAVNGSNAFAGYWNSREDQVRLLVTQDALSDALRRSLQSGNRQILQSELSDIASTTGLSFLTVVDVKGKVVARANGAAGGSMASDSYVARALGGEIVTSAVLLTPQDLAAEGLNEQAAANVTYGGTTVGHVSSGLAMFTAAPMSDAEQRTIGAIYGGILLNHYYDLVDSSTKSLGGQTAVLQGDAIVSSTIPYPDHSRVIDVQVPLYDKAKLASGTAYVGRDTEGGTTYLARLSPITNDRDAVIGALWYGLPLSQITSIIDHMTSAFVIWGLVAMLLALLVAVPVVERLSGQLARRSEQVSAAAKELGVAIVGGEVSSDHVAMTKAAVERAGELIEQIGDRSAADVAELKAVNDELHGDVIVIDTLSQEMSGRLQHAVARVAELNDVARGLDELVHGTPPN
jgi:hypothetical protein